MLTRRPSGYGDKFSSWQNKKIVIMEMQKHVYLHVHVVKFKVSVIKILV